MSLMKFLFKHILPEESDVKITPGMQEGTTWQSSATASLSVPSRRAALGEVAVSKGA